MKPILLDLFCGAGGAAKGYMDAGFYVIGIDSKPQPHYPGEFLERDAMAWVAEHGHKYAAIHASPPCQAYSRATAWRGDRADHPDLIAEVRGLLLATSRPFVIENVQDARRHLRQPIMLCGTSFGLPIQRHRYFECSWPTTQLLPACQHRRGDFSHDHGGKQTESQYREAMGVMWMTVMESRQAIPPAYTRFLGKQLMEYLEGSR